MDEANTLELIHLSAGSQAISVRLADRVPAWAPDYYAADIFVTSGFVNAQLRIHVTPEDLDHWAEALDRIEADDSHSAGDDLLTVDWPPTGRDGYLRFVADDPYVVEVHDAPQTQISVSVPLDMSDGWIPEARQKLQTVRTLLG
ncbi:DUF5959 family protein [Streptomyces roseoverticillatus]|uniref:DUF5959 family protein n=1 Tax=Streptomyces roseoverticillatus TaxID=66429 RepID=A0ABV3IXU0_9ACTN